MTVGALVVSAAISSAALMINPMSPVYSTGNQTSQAQINTLLASYNLGITEVYKQNVGENSDTGSLASSYATVFNNTPTDPSDATITWIPNTPFVSPTAYMLVKNGAHSPAWYFFDLTSLGWDGKETLELSGFWPREGAISHVALYTGDSNRVPDNGTTLISLGIALLGLGSVRKLIGSKA